MLPSRSRNMDKKYLSFYLIAKIYVQNFSPLSIWKVWDPGFRVWNELENQGKPLVLVFCFLSVSIVLRLVIRWGIGQGESTLNYPFCFRTHRFRYIRQFLFRIFPVIFTVIKIVFKGCIHNFRFLNPQTT